jgi:hypothetical protein
MTVDERIELLLELAWQEALDANPDVWHLSPWAHIIFEIGQKVDERRPGRLDELAAEKMT